MHAGDVLVVDVPSSESLRAAARVVRELAGKQLRGICVFRLPARDDPATLTVAQVTSALNDEDSAPRIDIRIKRETPESNSVQTGPGRWRLELKNMGTASALVGTATIDLVVRPGTFEKLTSQAAAVETMCEVPNPTSSVRTLQSCSQRRANVIRLKPQTLKPGQTLEAVLVLKQDPPQNMMVSIEMQTDAGQSFSIKQEVPVETGVNR